MAFYKHTFAWLALAMMVVGCSEPPAAKSEVDPDDKIGSTPGGTTGPADTGDVKGTEPVDTSKLGDTELRSKFEEDLLLAKKQEAVFGAICGQLQNIRNNASCQAMTRLVDSEEVLACLGTKTGAVGATGSAAQSLKTVFEVSATGASGQVKLSVNDGEYFSSPFNGGAALQQITWVNPGNLEKLSPRLLDVTSLALVDANNKPVSLTGLVLKVNKIDLKVKVNGGNIDVSSFQSAFAASSCRKSQADVDAIKKGALATSIELDAAEKSKLSSASREQLQSDIATFTARVDVANAQILAIEKEMLTFRDVGCWGDKDLASLEVRFDYQVVDSCEISPTMSFGIVDQTFNGSPSGFLAQGIKGDTRLAGKKLRSLGEVKVMFNNFKLACNSFIFRGADFYLDGKHVGRATTPFSNGVMISGASYVGSELPMSNVKDSTQYKQVMNLAQCTGL